MLLNVEQREPLDVEEVGRAQVLVALRLVGVDALRPDGEGRPTSLGVIRGKRHGAVEVGEAAADLRDQVADLERRLGMGGVNLVGLEGGRGGGSHDVVS